VAATQPAPDLTIYAFHLHEPAFGRGRLAADTDWLAALGQKWGDRLLVVEVVASEEGADWRALPAAVALDEGGAMAGAFLGGASAWNMVAVDRAGKVAWLGRPEHGLPDVVAAATSGSLDAQREAANFRMRYLLRGSYEEASPAEFAAAARQLCVRAPGDALAWALEFLASTELLHDESRALLAVESACNELKRDPRLLASFADLALRFAPRNRALGERLAAVLQREAASAETSPLVQLALLRAQVVAAQSRAVGRQAHRVKKLIRDHDEALLDFALILAADPLAPVHADLAEQALVRAEQLEASAARLAATRYVVRRRCREDPAGAATLLETYIGTQGADANPNNLAWNLLTDLDHIGRFDVVALGLAERMLQSRETMDAFELDTAALALFRAGRPQEAAQLQAEAIAAVGAQPVPEYEVRLQRYKGAGAGPR
jgi:hypothetical protein